MAMTATAEPIRPMSALAMCAATNSPHEPPVRASPIRSRTCAHLLMMERVFHSSVRLIIQLTYQKQPISAIDKDPEGQTERLSSSNYHGRHLPSIACAHHHTGYRSNSQGQEAIGRSTELTQSRHGCR